MRYDNPTLLAAMRELASQPGAALVYTDAGGLYQEGTRDGRRYLRQVARLDGLSESEARRLHMLAAAWHRRQGTTCAGSWQPVLPTKQLPQ